MNKLNIIMVVGKRCGVSVVEIVVEIVASIVASTEMFLFYLKAVKIVAGRRWDSRSVTTI